MGCRTSSVSVAGINLRIRSVPAHHTAAPGAVRGLAEVKSTDGLGLTQAHVIATEPAVREAAAGIGTGGERVPVAQSTHTIYLSIISRAFRDLTFTGYRPYCELMRTEFCFYRKQKILNLDNFF